MKHKKTFRKFGRTPAHRRAMFRNMATSFLEHGSIQTTVEKAKDLRRIVEPLITLAGEDNLHRRRKAYNYLMSKDVVHKLFAEIGPKYKEREGGYTRVVRTVRRPGDAAEMAVIQLVTEELKKKKKKARPKKEAKKEEKQPVEVKAEEDAEQEVVAENAEGHDEVQTEQKEEAADDVAEEATEEEKS